MNTAPPPKLTDRIAAEHKLLKAAMARLDIKATREHAAESARLEKLLRDQRTGQQ